MKDAKKEKEKEKLLIQVLVIPLCISFPHAQIPVLLLSTVFPNIVFRILSIFTTTLSSSAVVVAVLLERSPRARRW